jgi:hypothetical protein
LKAVISAYGADFADGYEINFAYRSQIKIARETDGQHLGKHLRPGSRHGGPFPYEEGTEELA